MRIWDLETDTIGLQYWLLHLLAVLSLGSLSTCLDLFPCLLTWQEKIVLTQEAALSIKWDWHMLVFAAVLNEIMHSKSIGSNGYVNTSIIVIVISQTKPDV